MSTPQGTQLLSATTEREDVSVAGPSDRAEVESFVLGETAASAYHLPAFARVVRRGGGLPVVTFLARRAGRIVGLLPVALTRSVLFGTYATSLPYFNYGGVLAKDGACARALVGAGWTWARLRGARHLILRHTRDRPLELPESRGKSTLLLPLPSGDPEELWKALGSKTRNLVRKAERAGATAAVEGRASLGAFHAVFAENMRDLGTPSLGPLFFSALFDEVPEATSVHVVRVNGRVAGAAIGIRFRDRFEVPWASTLRRFRASAANMLLYWHLLRHATLAGVRTFDFGRSTPGSGPYAFKLQWGAVPEPLPWYHIAADGGEPARDLTPQNPRFGLAIRAWQKLPLGVARVLGSYLAPSLP